MNTMNLSVILVTVFMSACAQLLLKLGMQRAGVDFMQGGVAGILRVLFSPHVFSGIFVYAVSVLVWLWVLSRVDLSIAYPFVGLSFIFTLLFGYAFLGESVNAMRIGGSLLIAAGCIFVAKS
ncbi:EamA family transporter [Microbulbifer bruguierae]|uniref:EamA family transporter n=1 Tax=Microbulbifer bruguierae TaxID=3029061 RepID=A0ABY8N8R7_9GAMM|nr:EamA family transporter [Microbulbifer bruguierae]WGL15301.1 EamA family transporter [Microbulbifer bruguierae]